MRQLEGSNIRGRIYLSSQGINAQYSGPRDAAFAYAEWVASQPGFQVLKYAHCSKTLPTVMQPLLSLSQYVQESLMSQSVCKTL